MKRLMCGAVGIALPIFVATTSSSAGYVFDFEDTTSLGYGNDSLLSRFATYQAGGCTFRMGWDTNHDLEADQDLRFEDYNTNGVESIGVGGYALASYSTQFQSGDSSWDRDYAGNGGNWFLRANKEDGFNRNTGRMLVSMEGFIWQVGGQMNDLDHGEQYTITAYADDGSVIDTVNSPVHSGVGGESLNGRSWTFSLGSGDDHYNIAYLAIEMTNDGTGGGFGFDNFTFVPAPGALALLGMAGLTMRGRRRQR
ncbi:MAG: PEP-CTERM sorting domain-containing protein [Planctomycetota bacterium]|nr:PEP-CTERM sorting domain-containing protein [Planctomycetota bacterium]